MNVPFSPNLHYSPTPKLFEHHPFGFLQKLPYMDTIDSITGYWQLTHSSLASLPSLGVVMGGERGELGVTENSHSPIVRLFILVVRPPFSGYLRVFPKSPHQPNNHSHHRNSKLLRSYEPGTMDKDKISKKNTFWSSE